MDSLKKNKEFILEYINSVSGKVKTREMLEKYNSDPGLVDNILFFDSVFPAYEIRIDELMAEGDRVMVRARLVGKHEGELMGIPATHADIEIPYVVGYEIQNKKITHSWLISDMLSMFDQMGVKGVPSAQPLAKEMQ